MASVDVVVMPSRWEAYGLVAAEVMAVGTPLIASDCLGLREVINGTPARSFTNGSVDELVECLLAEHRSNTKKEAADYAPIAVNRFDFQPHARDIQNLLLEANDA